MDGFANSKKPAGVGNFWSLPEVLPLGKLMSLASRQEPEAPYGQIGAIPWIRTRDFRRIAPWSIFRGCAGILCSSEGGDHPRFPSSKLDEQGSWVFGKVQSRRGLPILE
jgi:hypothetical protein